MTRLLAAGLLALVALVHYGLEPLSLLWSEPERVHRALFYIGQGAKGCALFITIALLAPRRLSSMPLYAVCAWGLLEDSQVAVCRLALGVENTPAPVQWAGLCSELTSLPLYVVGLLVGLICACVVEYWAKANGQNRRGDPGG